MRLRIEATPDELADKANDLVKALAATLAPVAPDLAEALEKALEKAVPKDTPKMLQPALREIHEVTRKEYERRLKWMVKDIGAVLDRAVLAKGDPGYTPPPATIEASIRMLEHLTKAGPYIGPRGGKWADAKHTQPWKEGVPHEQLTEEAHAVIKKDVVAAAHRAIGAGADATKIKYVGAGAEGIIFEDGSGKAFKVGRSKRSTLRNEAEATQSLEGTAAAKFVPKVYNYDAERDVVVRDKIEGRPGGWGTRGLRDAYEVIVAELEKKEWSAPEFKEDSFILDESGKNPKMIDIGFVHPRGQREVKYVERILAGAKSKADIDLLDIGFSIRSLISEGHLSLEKAAKMRAQIVEHHGTKGLEISQFLRELDGMMKRQGALAKAEGDEPGEEKEKLEPGDINPETGEEVPEEEEPEDEDEDEDEEETE